ncbi:1-acyl-sn-glycerol-3-phosphate acyltransferase [Agromyces rhizosphaerae]|uniref:1-acyl-sn-glycerol-3-phosphate acyltransferase n=1 Tax=Agromyces rhizosphaerae TaxID=88374 RepID=A0A9W6CTU3_9MICO|nr:lysophospholipid acyltransferase family protein [Agromyces rhizosphaerae]GLI25956.1 1-acyl-sn-glycerol-3-phosphate acyltransferase [Agromyces rhizosphaerae]
MTAPSARRATRPGFVYFLVRGILRPLALLVYRPTITGREHVPRTGPVVIASNHLSLIDSIVIPIVAPRPVQFLTKSDYFTGTGVSGWISRAFFEAIGAVAVERGAGSQAQAALDRGRDVLESGSAFAIYPEGSRSTDGLLYRGRTGVAWLSLATGAPVVPVGLIGTEAIQPVGTRWPRVRPVEVHFGPPIVPDAEASETSGRARRELTEQVMAGIHALSGQELAGRYNDRPMAA